MRDTARCRWQRWRVALVPADVAVPAAERFVRRHAAHAEAPGPDGIRHELVERVRAEIAAGTYDAEEKWLAAEERLIRAAGG
ncbi:MAG: flagellar biosynthesis anti-sigma factor FlgM [Gemmataceae bacterium]|nr:flagellar biosynthesis anti-sigma factor FlgM [Gemmataceae bacterium]